MRERCKVCMEHPLISRSLCNKCFGAWSRWMATFAFAPEQADIIEWAARRARVAERRRHR